MMRKFSPVPSVFLQEMITLLSVEADLMMEEIAEGPEKGRVIILESLIKPRREAAAHLAAGLEALKSIPAINASMLLKEEE